MDAAVDNTGEAHDLTVILPGPALQIIQVPQIISQTRLQLFKEPLRLPVGLLGYPEDTGLPQLRDRQQGFYEIAIPCLDLPGDRRCVIGPPSHGGYRDRIQGPRQESPSGEVLVAHDGLQHYRLYHQQHGQGWMLYNLRGPSHAINAQVSAGVSLEEHVHIHLSAAVASGDDIEDAALIRYNSHSPVIGGHQRNKRLWGGIIGQQPQGLNSLPLQVRQLILQLRNIIQIDILTLFCGLPGRLLHPCDPFLQNRFLRAVLIHHRGAAFVLVLLKGVERARHDGQGRGLAVRGAGDHGGVLVQLFDPPGLRIDDKFPLHTQGGHRQPCYRRHIHRYLKIFRCGLRHVPQGRREAVQRKRGKLGRIRRDKRVKRGKTGIRRILNRQLPPGLHPLQSIRHPLQGNALLAVPRDLLDGHSLHKVAHNVYHFYTSACSIAAAVSMISPARRRRLRTQRSRSAESPGRK